MSEPMSAEERARLREWAEAQGPEHPLGSTVTALLDEVDRLTEALEQAAKERTQLSGIAEAADRRWLDTLKRAERAEADLADEKRRHAETTEDRDMFRGLYYDGIKAALRSGGEDRD